MIICNEYKIEDQRIIPLKPISCPQCGGITISRGYVRRKTKNFLGQTTWYKIQKRKCTKCGKMFVVLPDFILPYKQYDIR